MNISAYILQILGSALFLGCYDIARKRAVQENPVFPVLFFATASGTLLLVLLQLCAGTLQKNYCCTPGVAGLLLLKSVLVGSSWCCVYYAMRALPLSLAAPVRSSSPLWTFLGGLILFGEIPSLQQAFGMLLVFGGYVFFSLAGKLDGFFWRRSWELHCIILGTLLGAISALYDKYLLNALALPRDTVQLHFQIDLIGLFALALLFRAVSRSPKKVLHWRPSIFLTGILLVIADYLYFTAVGVPDASISILSLLRRSSCLVPFAAGILFFKERNIRVKGFALLLILCGVFFLSWKG